MSQENVELVRRMYEACRSGDAEVALACYRRGRAWSTTSTGD